MKCVQYHRYGAADVLAIEEVRIPRPGQGQVRIRVEAASVNPKDVLTRAGRFRRLAGGGFPKRCGLDFGGVIDELGPGVTGLAVGDPVFGMLNDWNGGSCAEFVVADTSELARRPAGMDAATGAALALTGQTALQAMVGLMQVRPGYRICINGAAGGVGTAAVQIAVALGADVTAVCSAASAALVASLGAARVIDHASQTVAESGLRFDGIFDCFGNLDLAAVRGNLEPGGLLVGTVPSRKLILAHLLTFLWPGRRARLVVVHGHGYDLETLAMFFEVGALRAVIDSRYPLAAIADAHRRIETRRAHGKIIIDIAAPDA